MKKYILTAILVILTLVSCKDKSGLEGLLVGYDERITTLEELCGQMNTNISALQTIVQSLDSAKTISSLTPIILNGDTIGYTMAFNDGKLLNIYSQQQTASDTTNVIGIKLADDNLYYWTKGGKWLLDNNGNKLAVTGETGATPKFKIEDEYWYVSYDNGFSWSKLDKATGQQGKAGDSMFKSVTQDSDNVYFTLSDNTVITMPKTGNGEIKIVDGAIQAAFSVSATQKVYFSQGNLQFNAGDGQTHACAVGTTQAGTWRFAEHQWDYVGDATLGTVYIGSTKCNNLNVAANYNGWIDHFSWGTSGWNSGATCYQPYSRDDDNTHYYPGGSATSDLTNDYAYADWGVYNAISNGGNQPGLWRTLTQTEWVYLIEGRPHANNLVTSATVNNVRGMLLLPDNFSLPNEFHWFNYSKTDYTANVFTEQEWGKFESLGAVFMPITGVSGYVAGKKTITNVDLVGYYWSSKYKNENSAWVVYFNLEGVGITPADDSSPRYSGMNVRLVKDVK